MKIVYYRFIGDFRLLTKDIPQDKGYKYIYVIFYIFPKKYYRYPLKSGEKSYYKNKGI